MPLYMIKFQAFEEDQEYQISKVSFGQNVIYQQDLGILNPRIEDP